MTYRIVASSFKGMHILAFATLIQMTTSSFVPFELVPSNFYSILSREKIILVAFMAPWCPHCKDLEPEINAAAEELAEFGISVFIYIV